MKKRRQLIIISPIGGVTGLRCEGGVPLESMGPARMDRVSDIQYSAEWGGYYVPLLRGPRAGNSVHEAMWKEYGLKLPKRQRTAPGGTLLFPSYAAAVAAEVKLVNAALTRGESWQYAE